MEDAPRKISVVIPVYNEEENVAALAGEIDKALAVLEISREIIFVDDGSTDRSYEILRGLARTKPGFKVVRLGRNAGQTAALAAGFELAGGDVIAAMDADGQNDPNDIPALLKVLENGYDVVSGWRKERKDLWLTRRLPSQMANFLISWMTGIPLHDYGCTLKLYRARFLKPLKLYGEMHRFIPALAGFLGARIAEVPVHHRPRTLGRSKYGLSRTFKVMLDLLTVKFMDAYMGKPIYLFGGWGLALGGLGLFLSAVTLYKKFFLHVYVKDQPLFQVSIFFLLAGFILVLMGLIAEILTRIYFDLKDKSPYFINEMEEFQQASSGGS